jgi:PAS domain S-box-containing protein
MEQALRESEARFRFIFENAADGLLLADADTGQFAMANDTICRMIGHSHEAILQLAVRDIHPEDALSEVLKTFSKLARGEVQLARSTPVKTRGGRVIYCDINAIPLTMHGKTHVLGVFRDVTEQKMLSEKLRESEQLYRTLVEGAGEAIARVNVEGQFLFMNKTAAHRLGGKPEDYIGKTMWDLFPSEIADRQAASVRHVIETGRGMNEVTPTFVGGEMRWYNTTVEPLRDGDGDIASALIIGRDIHDLREAQRKIEEYRTQMARTEQLASLGTLSATVAHELNQPLTVIQLNIQNCLAELEHSEAMQQTVADLKDCLHEVSTASAIVGRFKQFARYSRRRELTQVNLESIVEKVTRVWAEASERSGLSLVTGALDHLPDIYMDERDAEQLFFSLVENAIQAAADQKNHQLSITAEAKAAFVEVRFADNCGGIAPEDLDKIFQPFFTTKIDQGGTGLGLCVVEDIVRSASGKIRVDNRPGEGVTFVVTLPVANTDVKS